MPLQDIIDATPGAIDQPSVNDFVASHLFGLDPIPVPSSINLNAVPSHNQGSSWHCTSYGVTHIEEILNTIEHGQVVELNPEEQWENQCKARGVPSTISGGDTLQNALNTLVKNGLENKKNPNIALERFRATGFALVDKKIDAYLQWLTRGFPIYTGWKIHAFAIIGFDQVKKVFIAKNSYGPTWGANQDGTFTIGFDEFDQLFSGYIIYDKKDLVMIFRDVSEKSPKAEAIKFVLEKGLMKGYGDDQDPKNRFFRPDQPITRSEMAVVAQNLYNLLKS